MQNKVGFLIKFLSSKLKLFHLGVLCILKTTKIKTVLTSIHLVCVTRPTRCHVGAIRARLGPFGGALRKFWGFEATMRHHDNELICSRTAFCFINILGPYDRTEMVLYSKFAYGSQFSGEKNNLKIRYLVGEIFAK